MNEQKQQIYPFRYRFILHKRHKHLSGFQDLTFDLKIFTFS